MVSGPTLDGTAKSVRPSVRSVASPFLIIVTVYVCRRLRPSEPGPSREGCVLKIPGDSGHAQEKLSSREYLMDFSQPAIQTWTLQRIQVRRQIQSWPLRRGAAPQRSS